MTLQIIVAGVALSLDATEWGIVVVGLTEGGACGRAIVLADESGRMPSGEAAQTLVALAATGKVAAAAVAKDAAERLGGVLATATLAGHMPPPVQPMAVGDASGLWMGLIKSAQSAGRLTFAATPELDALERAVTEYKPGADSPRVAALLAAVSYLRDIGGLRGAGVPWSIEQAQAPQRRGAMMDGDIQQRSLATATHFDPRLLGR